MKMEKPQVITFIEPLYFNQFSMSGSYNGKTDGYYGYICKYGTKKPILHSKIKEMLDIYCHADFIYIG